MSKKVVDALNKFCAILSYCGSFWIFFLMAVIVVDVSGRVLINNPLTGTPEIVKNSIVGIAFFMMAWAAFEDRHVRTTMLLNRAPVKLQKYLNLFSHIVGFFLFTGIIISSWKPTTLACKILEFEGEGALRVPTYPVRIIIILGSILTAWQCLVKIIGVVMSIAKPGQLQEGKMKQ